MLHIIASHDYNIASQISVMAESTLCLQQKINLPLPLLILLYVSRLD